MESWNDVSRYADRVIAAGRVADETVGTLRDLIASAANRAPCTVVSVNDHMSSICLDWPSETSSDIQVEVHSDRYEIYLMQDGKTDIREFGHARGQPASPELVNLLPST